MSGRAGKSVPRSHPLYRAVASSGLSRAARRLARGGSVFCFHNVVARGAHGAGDASLHMEEDHFARIAEWIAREYDVLSVRELVSRVRAGRSVRRTAALTFDDTYRSVLARALPVLRRLELPATFYVVSGAATEPAPFWWDVLAGSGGGLPDDLRRRCLTEHRGVGRDILSLEGGSREATGADERLPASWAEIAGELGELGREGLFDVGSHTVGHPNLTACSDAELAAELEHSRETISERLSVEVSSISYPYGLHDDRVREAAARAGYEAGFTLGPGLVRPGGDPLGLPRLNVPATIGIQALDCWAVGLRPRSR